MASIYRLLPQLLGQEGSVQQVICLSGPRQWESALFAGDGRRLAGPESVPRLPSGPAALTETGEAVYFQMGITSGRVLFVCGGGHVSRPVCQLAALLGFQVTVADDRPEFADRRRFPQAEEVVCAPFEEALARPIPPGSSFVILTRGHQFDLACLRAVLGLRPGYVGMIGSRHKVAQTFRLLREAGVPQEALDQVHAPIGLDIGAQTPEEIAVSIAAELIQYHAGSGTVPLEQEAARLLSGPAPAVVCTVLSKQGSVPRGPGARMVVTRAEAAGTVGGGAVEYAALRRARDLLESGGTAPVRVRYDLSGQDAQRLGMVCGGTVELLLEPVAGREA